MDRVLLAASGGLDSTVLAHLLHEEGYTFGIAHCNYGLRGADSDGDAQFVGALAARLGAAFHVTTIELPRAGGETIQLQFTARTKRYKYFEKILDEYTYDVLCTAHHLDDSLETMLINLLRGTGLSGIRGIAPRTAFPVVRPLLEASRAEILAFARSRELYWREDASNASTNYLRNALRHRVVPLLREYGLQDDGLRGTLSHLRSAERLLLRGATREPAFVRTGPVLTWDRAGDELDPVDALTVLRLLSPDTGFTAEQYRQMVYSEGTTRLSSRTHEAFVSPGLVRLQPLAPSYGPHTVRELPYEVHLPGLGRLLLDVVPPPQQLKTAGTQYVRFPGFPLHLRPRRNGDRFAPLGMEGRTKKVKDYFTDAKVPPWERDATPLLCDADGHIVLIVGHRIAEPYAVGNEGKDVLRVRLQRQGPDPS